jgi:hypothetical protein
MFPFVHGIALVAAILASCGASFAQDIDSANYNMRGCRALMVEGPNSRDTFLQGKCAGIIDTVVEVSGTVCPPAGSSGVQALRIVVKYIDDRPARLHEKFTALAREALQAAWPCKK